MAKPTTTLDSSAKIRARVIIAWSRINNASVGVRTSARDIRSLITGGVLVRRGVWVEAAVNIRGYKAMSDYLLAA